MENITKKLVYKNIIDTYEALSQSYCQPRVGWKIIWIGIRPQEQKILIVLKPCNFPMLV